MEPKFKTRDQIAASDFTFNGRDIVSMSDFTREEIDYVLDVADWFKRMHDDGKREKLEEILDGVAVASIFAEPSTRTRCSFEAAAKVLDAEILAINDPKASSFEKGEPLQDALRVMERYVLRMGYGKAVAIMRHGKDGAARFAADVLKIPFLNGGDGRNQHPTQTFLDLYTIREAQKKIDGLKVAMVGDLKNGRTVHSLANALSKYKGVKLHFVASDILQMPEHIIGGLEEAKVEFELLERMEDVIKEVDILYMTRVQRERLTEEDKAKVKDIYRLNAAMLEGAKPNMKVMHPLPRFKYALEIAFDVDDTPHAYYFEQSENGLFTREALFALVTGRVGDISLYDDLVPLTEGSCSNDNCISNDEFEGASKYIVDPAGNCHYCERKINGGKK